MGHEFDPAFSKAAVVMVRLFGGPDQGRATVGSQVVQTRSGGSAVCWPWLVKLL
jgi:hypothetical protein